MENEFYMTLLSNSSAAYYPDNKTSSFNVHLTKEVNLEGKWAAAVTEITYPSIVENVTEGNNYFIVRAKYFLEGCGLIYFDDQRVEIDTGAYSSDDELMKKVNEGFYKLFGRTLLTKCGVNGCLEMEDTDDDGETMLESFFASQNFTQRASDMGVTTIKYVEIAKNHGIFNPYIKIAHIAFTPSKDVEGITIEFGGKLGLQLGFTPNTPLNINMRSNFRASVLHGLPAEIFVYLDVIEPQIVSDYSSQVARIVRSVNKTSHNSNITAHEFIHRNYMPLVKSRFQTVNVGLRDTLGNLIPFSLGTSCVTLHFKKIS